MARPRTPQELTRAPLRTFRPRDVAEVYAAPRAQLARLARGGAVRRLAPGYYTAIPDTAGTGWQPTLEAAALAIATTVYGPGVPVLMGAAAARIHRGLPRAIAVATVAVPRQHLPVHLDNGGTIEFVKRDVDRLDARMEVLPDLGQGLVTTEEQCVLDLARRGDHALKAQDVAEIIQALWPRCDWSLLARLAAEQRMRATLARVEAMVA